MANALYDLARQSFLKGEFALATDNIKAVLVQTGGGHYVVNLATDQFLSAIVAGDRLATSGNLTTKTTTAGVFDADDVTFAAVTNGAAVGAIVFYQDTGAAGTSRLICYEDTLTGFPFTASGADEVIVFDNGANKIFKL